MSKPVRRYLGIFSLAAYERMYGQLKEKHPELTRDQIRISMNEVLKLETEEYSLAVQRLVEKIGMGESR